MRIQREYFDILELITQKKFDPVDRFFYFRTHFMINLFFKDNELSWNTSSDAPTLGKQNLVEHKKLLLRSVVNAFKVRKASVPEKYIQITENQTDLDNLDSIRSLKEFLKHEMAHMKQLYSEEEADF